MSKRLIVNRRKVSRIFSILMLITVLVTAYFYTDWYVTQINKVRGMYLVWRGDRALRKYKFQKSIDYYQRGLALYPGHYSAWFNLGNIYVLYEDYYSAVDAYENAIEHNPNYVIARMNYGIISAERLGDFDGAIDQYKTILDIRRKLVYIPFVFNNLKSYKTNIGLAYYNMGLAYRQKSIYQENLKGYAEELNLRRSIDAYKESVKILKKSYDAYYNLGLVYHLYGDYRNAGLSYCKAIELKPLNYEAHYNLALLLRHLKFYKESVVEMQKATTLLTEKDGASYRQKYVFAVLNDISRRYIETKDSINYVNSLDSKIPKKLIRRDLTPSEAAADFGAYAKGHLVTSDDFEEAMTDNYAHCGSYSLFAEEELDEDDINY